MRKKGGNLIFSPGHGYAGDYNVGPGDDGDLIFKLANNTEAIRIDHNGDFWVNKRRVKNDMQVYCAFRSWLKTIGVIS